MYNWSCQRLKIMQFKLTESKNIVSVLIILFACFCKILCQPQLETTTPKVYKDKFPLNKQTRPIPPNSSLNERVQEAFRSGFVMDSPNRKVEVSNPMIISYLNRKPITYLECFRYMSPTVEGKFILNTKEYQLKPRRITKMYPTTSISRCGSKFSENNNYTI